MFRLKTELVIRGNKIIGTFFKDHYFKHLGTYAGEGNRTIIVFISGISCFVFDDWDYGPTQEGDWEPTMNE